MIIYTVVYQITAISLFLRKFKEAELQSALQLQQQTFRPRSSLASSLQKSISCTRATPSLPKPPSFPPLSVPHISSSSLLLPEGDTEIGKGRFGTCSKMIFKDIYPVCVKVFADNSPLSLIRAEASLLCHLNCGEHTPHCFGLCVEKRAIITSYISICNKPITLHTFLHDCGPNEGSSLQDIAVNFLSQIVKGIQFVHEKQILHNDLKCDNVVVGHTLTNNLKLYIIDFGKSCMISNAKHYKLSSDEVEMYKKEHPQIAPDLRDGLVPQSTATDVYALGRIIKKINHSLLLQHDDVFRLSKQSLAYHSHERPTLSHIAEAITNLSIL